jgi:hypothetical protein
MKPHNNVFALLELDDASTMSLPYVGRRARLGDLDLGGAGVRVPPYWTFTHPTAFADAQAQLRQIAQQLSATHRRVETLAFAGYGAGANGDFLVSGDLLDSAVQVRLEGCWTENGPLPRAITQVFAQHRVSAAVSGFAGTAEFIWSPPAPGTRRPRRGPAGTVAVAGTSLNDF